MIKVSEVDYFDYIELLDLIEGTVLEEGFNKIVTETKVNFAAIPNSQFVIIETLKPVYDPRCRQLYFDTADVDLFIEYEDGTREAVEVV